MVECEAKCTIWRGNNAQTYGSAYQTHATTRGHSPVLSRFITTRPGSGCRRRLHRQVPLPRGVMQTTKQDWWLRRFPSSAVCALHRCEIDCEARQSRALNRWPGCGIHGMETPPFASVGIHRCLDRDVDKPPLAWVFRHFPSRLMLCHTKRSIRPSQAIAIAMA